MMICPIVEKSLLSDEIKKSIRENAHNFISGFDDQIYKIIDQMRHQVCKEEEVYEQFMKTYAGTTYQNSLERLEEIWKLSEEAKQEAYAYGFNYYFNKNLEKFNIRSLSFLT